MCEKKKRVFSNNKKKLEENKRSLDGIKNKKKTKNIRNIFQ